MSIIPFYSHKHSKIYNIFSNFYIHEPFEFIFPEYAQKPEFPNSVMCECSEKAIMLIKAILMNDLIIFNMIIHNSEPSKIKILGRKISPWNQELWDEYIEDIAFEVVFQKFSKLTNYTNILLLTDNNIIVEASPYDDIWGVKLSINNSNIYNIQKWKGKNILGYALMEAREAIKNNLTERKRISRHYD